MSKHSPGPWMAVPTEKFGDENPHRFGIICERQPIVAKPPYDICAVFERGGVEKTTANAKLIAAAPDLLEALRSMLERYTQLVNCGDCGNWDPETESEVIQSRAAIAKATGEQA